jgi:hypothetical protein
MKAKIIQLLFSAGFILISVASLAQCEIKNRIYPDGSMLFYMEPVNFYWTESKATIWHYNLLHSLKRIKVTSSRLILK